MNYIYDTFIKKVDILSKALEKATERTRTMMYVVTFFSLLIFVTSFNAYLAWDRKLNAHERMLITEELKLIPPLSLKKINHELASSLRKSSIEKYKDVTDEHVDSVISHLIYDLQKNYTSDTLVSEALEKYTAQLEENKLTLPPTDYFKFYIERQKFTIPLIGLTCYADDVYLIGGLGLVILLSYSFFNIRRENRIVERIAKTIQYIDKSDPREYLQNHPYSNKELQLLKHNLLEYAFYGCVEFFIFNTGLTRTDYSSFRDHNKLKDTNKSRTNNIGRWVLSALYFLPIFSISFSMLFEVKSFIDRHKYMNQSDYIELVLRYGLLLFFLGIIIGQIRVINKLNYANSKLIEEMYDTIKKSRIRTGLD